tara:strand:- start:389 stop:628 length:240 start_codon:yes stop_codon:yes gene_type:complete
MKKCLENCIKKDKKCGQTDCRVWIDYEKDLNCSLLSVKKHGAMTLEETAKRLNLSIVRVKQLQDRALQKLQKNRRLKGL